MNSQIVDSSSADSPFELDFPFLPGFERPEFFSDNVDFNQHTVKICGWSSASGEGKVVTGAAASLEGNPSDRAYYELLERCAIVHALDNHDATYLLKDLSGSSYATLPHSSVFPATTGLVNASVSKSNGVAFHFSWREACKSALLELHERDAILRSWYGQSIPTPIAVKRRHRELFSNSHHLETFRVGEPRYSVIFQKNIEIAMAIAWPRQPGAAFVLGAGAAFDLPTAMSRAVAECLQASAFLQGETWDHHELPPISDPRYHQAYYQNPDHWQHIIRWLNGDFCNSSGLHLPLSQWHETFVDLTPQNWNDRCFVAKAMADQCLLLFFGADPRGPSFPPHPIT